MAHEIAANDFLLNSSLPAQSSMSKTSPFSILPTRLQCLPITSVISEATYNYYGSLTTDNIIEEASSFLASHSDAEVPDSVRTLNHFLHLTLQDFLDEKKLEPSRQISLGAWFTIRMTSPNLEYTNMPRWHRDGRMFYCDVEGDINSKYAITLLGNPTRVLAESDLVRKSVTGRQDKRREEYSEQLALEPILDIKRGEIIKFSWGETDSPVHSEPDEACDRVFVSVLFGSQREIRNMCNLRECTYRE
jgi:hypothetical protein